MLEQTFPARVGQGIYRDRRLALAAAAGVMAAAVMTLGVQRARGSPSYTIAEVGLTGPNYTYAGSGGFYQSSSGGQLSSGGDASGVSNRFSSTGGNLGQDTWFYNGSTTQQIGLTGGGYS